MIDGVNVPVREKSGLARSARRRYVHALISDYVAVFQISSQYTIIQSTPFLLLFIIIIIFVINTSVYLCNVLGIFQSGGIRVQFPFTP